MTLQTYEMVWRHAHHGYTILLPLIIASSSSLGGHAQLLGTLSRQQDLGEEVRRIINNDQYSIPPGQRPRSLVRDDEEEDYTVDNYYRKDDEYDYFDPTLVDFVYTFGSPSTARNPYISNPGNKCIPGIRTYTEDLMSSSSGGNNCDWWEQLWCTNINNDSNNNKPVITNTDFAAKINIEDYPHPKMSTLILRYVDGTNVEYVYKECNDDDYIKKYNFQSWPTFDQPSEILPGLNIHELDTHYEPRLLDVPSSIRSQLLDYLYVAMCGKKSESTIANCLSDYGVTPKEWTMLAYMNHITDYGVVGTDEDVVFVLKNDNRYNYRKCIISFAGSGRITGDLTDFILSNSESTRYCGRQGIHAGVSDELWHITHDAQYFDSIKPALETCHEVTCVGYSLGGALCTLFTMCANNVNGANNDDYQTLAWKKALYSINDDDDDDDNADDDERNYANDDDNINYAKENDDAYEDKDDDYANEDDDSS